MTGLFILAGGFIERQARLVLIDLGFAAMAEVGVDIAENDGDASALGFHEIVAALCARSGAR